MKVHALINVYNDRMFLPAMLDSIKEYVDAIHIADGAYKEYLEVYRNFSVDVRPRSTDGTLEILKAIPGLPDHDIIYCPEDTPWINQNAKRSALLDAVPVGDWFIIIDADEMLSGDVAEGLETFFDSGCIQGSVPFYNAGLDVDRMHHFWHPRVFEKLPGMHYYKTHWQLRDGFNRIIEGKYPIKWTSQFVFVHFKALKPPERTLPHAEYMSKIGMRGWIEKLERADVDLRTRF